MKEGTIMQTAARRAITATPEEETVTAPVQIVPKAARSANIDGTPASLKTLCSTCHLKDLCLPCGLTGSDVQRLDTLMFARRRIKEGQALYHEGEKFQFI
jgi:CRP/FNR family transcriptional regulator